MPVFDEPLITDWTSPLYKLKQTWAACGNDVNSISLACHENHGKPVAIQCRDCHGAIVDRIHRVFQSPPVDAWFSNRPAFLAELDDMFARARTYDLDMQAISNRIKAEKIQWYRDMVTQYPLLIAVLESTHSSDHVARLLGSDHEMAAPSPPPGQPPPPVEFDFGVLSEAVALAIGPPQGRNIGPTEVNQYAALRRASEDEAAKKVAIEGWDKHNKGITRIRNNRTTNKRNRFKFVHIYLYNYKRYAQIYQDSNISIERLMSMIEADLRRTSSNTTPTTHLHGPPDRRRALGLGTATPLTPEQRQRVDQLVRIIDAQGKRTAEIAAMRTRMAELQRAKRANEEDAARKKREKVAAEEKRRVEAIQAAEAEVKAKAAALSSGDKMDIDDPNKIPTSIFTSKRWDGSPANTNRLFYSNHHYQYNTTQRSTRLDHSSGMPNDAHIANFHRDAFADGRGMPKTLVLEDFLAKRLDMFVKGAKMEFAGKR
ncbi:hypothetical protein CFO_g3375 [Ceratocystis platani]|uniref:Uncharacterized protein n=1 Tax=Ceratocystis fimbriata f. sp. platani TaxID=88771 RepID=A0A0F8CU75_CERFI|nr:hypothetical protein CFO_g3375 [Ceratocystis platani]